jgi:L-lysine exporter family protein LysE/ArgO
MPSFASAFAPAFFFSLSLIAAIGAQNAFVLRQGLRREHVLVVVLICAGSDAVLIGAGMAGFGTLAGAAPWLSNALRYAGAAFLVAYGARAFLAAWRGGAVLAAGAGGASRIGTVIATCLALTWLNPHVYLDTVVLMGAVSAGYPGQGAVFWLGATAASFTFFFCLGFGARLLAPVFARPVAWRWLDAGVGVVMWAIAALLLRG